MKKLVPLVVAAALAGTAPAAHGQLLIEANGEVTYTGVDVRGWLGDGVFDPQRFGYAGSALVLSGRRGAGGFHYGLEVGWGRLMDYSLIYQGERYQSGINVLRVQAVVRFWFDNGAWFGEGMGGIVNLDGASSSGRVTDPTLGAGIGRPWQLSDQLSLVTRASGNAFFDAESLVLTFRAVAGLSWTPGS